VTSPPYIYIQFITDIVNAIVRLRFMVLQQSKWVVLLFSLSPRYESSPPEYKNKDSSPRHD